MTIFSRMVFEVMKWQARRGQSGGAESLADGKERAWQRIRGAMDMCL
jgi:hypothetical protein